MDFAVNNAGVHGGLMETAMLTVEDWNRTVAINLKGVFLCMQREIRQMVSRGKGAIVNMASTAALEGYVNASGYVASKHAVLGLTRTAALE